MLKNLPLLTLFICLLTSAAQAQDGEKLCSQLKDFEIKPLIKIIIKEPEFDFTKTGEELNKISENSRKQWLEKNESSLPPNAKLGGTLGLVAPDFHGTFRTSIDYKRTKRNGKEACPYFKTVELIVLLKQKVMIDKQFKEGSCFFKEVMTHEMIHFNDNKAALELSSDPIKTNILKIISDIELSEDGPPSSEAFARGKAMNQKMRDVFKEDFAKTLQSEAIRRGDLLDTPEEYMRATKAKKECDKIEQAAAVQPPQ